MAFDEDFPQVCPPCLAIFLASPLSTNLCSLKDPILEVDPNAVVSLAAAAFTRFTCSDEAPSFCYTTPVGPLTNGPDVALHERTIAVPDASAYVSANESICCCSWPGNEAITTSGSNERPDSLRNGN